MKKIIFLFSLFMPIMCFGLDDACTKPDEYTVDKRCYVTDAQKKEKPYNAVVGLINRNGDIYCTGTLAKNGDKVYLYTAKHCTDRNDDEVFVDEKLRIKTQSGKKLTVHKSNSGSADMSSHSAQSQRDWAVYSIKETDGLDYVNLTEKRKLSNIEKKYIEKEKFYKYAYDARVVGYGSLKIMSDNEIEKFKNDYIKWLKRHGITDDDIKSYPGTFDMSGDGGVDVSSYITDEKGEYAIKEYLSSGRFDYLFFNDARLKVSRCRYLSVPGHNYMYGCQAWQGNSGGPIFDDDDNLMAIVVGGTPEGDLIGGKKHAQLGTTVTLIKDNDQSFIKNAISCVGKLCDK